MRSKLALVALLLLTPGSAFAAEFINDSLVDPSGPGRGSQGGTFDGTGWTTTGPTDAVWYEVPEALVSGKIGFSVKGMAHDPGPLSGADHDIFTMYQAPSGQAEPVAYSPYFRNNDFKAFLRIFGVQEPGRAGAMKLEFIRCPRGEPWYHDEACPPECGEGLLGYANGMDKDIGWDAAAWYRIEMTWGNGQISFSRDGNTLATLDYQGVYAPKPLRVRIGSPRHGISDVAYMPQGLTFKDVLVTGEPGEMPLACMSTGTGGSGGSTGSGGMTGGGGAGGSPGDAGLAPLQDVTAASWEPAVFEDVTDLNVEGDGANPTSVVYLRFPQPQGAVAKAVLRMRAHAYGSASGGTGVVHGVMDSSWSEDTMTWATRPAFDAMAYGTPSTVAEDAYVEWDVTPLVSKGIVNFAVVSTDGDGAHFRSKEAEGGVNGPRLVLTLDPTGAGGAAGASSGMGGASGGSGQPSAGSAGAVSSGGKAGSSGAPAAAGQGGGTWPMGGSGAAGKPASGGSSGSGGGLSSGSGGAPPASGSSGSSGKGGGGGKAPLGGSDTSVSDTPDEGGCGCQAPRSRGGPFSVVIVAGLGLLALVRRRAVG